MTPPFFSNPINSMDDKKYFKAFKAFEDELDEITNAKYNSKFLTSTDEKFIVKETKQ